MRGLHGIRENVNVPCRRRRLARSCAIFCRPCYAAATLQAYEDAIFDPVPFRNTAQAASVAHVDCPRNDPPRDSMALIYTGEGGAPPIDQPAIDISGPDDRFVEEWHEDYELGMFPLLYPDEHTWRPTVWGRANGRRLAGTANVLSRYVRNKLLHEPILDVLGDLSEQWVLAMWSRVEKMKIRYWRTAQMQGRMQNMYEQNLLPAERFQGFDPDSTVPASAMRPRGYVGGPNQQQRIANSRR